jgi:dTDP-4-amino-4,6-dideoxygalactose transaminase
MVLSDSEDLISRIKDLREYDNKDNYILRYNYKMTDIQAALGLSQLSFLEKFIERRREIAACYFQEFKNCDFSLPVVEKEKDHIYYRFVIKTKEQKTVLLNILRNFIKRILCASGLSILHSTSI